VPTAGYRPGRRVGAKLATIDAHRAAEAAADVTQRHSRVGVSLCLLVINMVFCIRPRTSKIDNHIPISRSRHHNSGRKHSIKSTVISVRLTTVKYIEIRVISESNVTLMVAFYYYYITLAELLSLTNES
jgi:hypothetical protein